MNDTLNNELAQVCNNLYCLLQDVRYYRSNNPQSTRLQNIDDELLNEYNTLFKLIYDYK